MLHPHQDRGFTLRELQRMQVWQPRGLRTAPGQAAQPSSAQSHRHACLVRLPTSAHAPRSASAPIARLQGFPDHYALAAAPALLASRGASFCGALSYGHVVELAVAQLRAAWGHWQVRSRAGGGAAAHP